ncbi:MAG: radical SAM protein [Verrucomicrobiia bacterium]
MTVRSPSAGPILPYQADRTLDRVSGYLAGLQLRLSDGKRVYVARSSTELAVYFESDLALHYDLEGRLTKIATPHEYRRRSLSHRILQTQKLAAEDGGGIARVVLPAEAADEVVAEAHKRLCVIHEHFQAGVAQIDPAQGGIEFGTPAPDEAQKKIGPVLERAVAFDVDVAREDARRFRQLYGRVAVLPPDQYNALVLQATEGCAYGHCLFCELYHGVTHRCKTAQQFREHVRAAIAYHGEALRARRSIFLGEANALMLPQAELVEFLHVLHEHFELPSAEQQDVPARWWLGSKTRFDGVSSFQDAFTEPHRSVAEFAELRRLGLRRVYIGLESGHDPLLRWLRKPATAATIFNTVQTLKEARIAVGMIALLGAGGHKFSAAHVHGTTQLLNELPLERGDYVYFSPLEVVPCGSYAVHETEHGIKRLTEAEMLAQERAIRAGLHFDGTRGKPYLARYEVETFVY